MTYSLPLISNRAQELYERIRVLPLICPHGHVNPALFADPNYHFGTPTELFIIPDHYIFRMLYSQGVSLDDLGISRTDGVDVEQNHRAIWQRFAEHFYLFLGTPTSIWFQRELASVFDIHEKLSSENAQSIYDHISQKLQQPDFTPQKLYDDFNIQTLCTTDSALDELDHHKTIQQSDWHGEIRPTFRPDQLNDISNAQWRVHIQQLSELCGKEVGTIADFITCIEERRAFFKSMGATATDHAVVAPYTEDISYAQADAIFQRALQHQASDDDAKLFSAFFLMEMARMSCDDGLVMQLHPGAFHGHNKIVQDTYGVATGGDIPTQTEYTHNLYALLNKFGNHANFSLILFTLDETNYARELAPIAGHYPSVKLGPPWWFHDSINGICRFLNQVVETAGIYNTVGFNDDTRAFLSISTRHDVWRRVCCNWLSGLLDQHIIDMHDAEQMAHELAYGLAEKAYKL